MSSVPPTIGVLALQGDVREHIHEMATDIAAEETVGYVGAAKVREYALS